MASEKQALPKPRYIDQPEAFNQLVKHLLNQDALAVDTEANSLYVYHEQVCLIQISTKKADYIIDPLALEDISPLGEVFQHPKIEKIFHASEYDILIMDDEFHFKFRNLFDTMLAAQILGRKKLGLDSLLEEIAGISVNKKYQRANWGKRPLSDDMLRYAQKDTHYLFKIRDFLSKELEANHLTLIAAEDFQRACHVHRNNHSVEKKMESCWKIRGSKKLPPQKAAVLKELCQYRDDTARKLNRPVFKVLSSQTLLSLAEHSPTSSSQLLKLNIPGKKVLKRHADHLVKAIQDGLAAEPVFPPQKEHLDDSYLAREKALRDWRKRTARKMNVNSAVVMPRELLYNLVSSNPTNPSELRSVLKEVPWRLDQFGDDILAALNDVNSRGY